MSPSRGGILSSIYAIVGKAHTVEPAETVVEEQQSVVEARANDTPHSDIVVAEFAALQPDTGVEMLNVVEQTISLPPVRQISFVKVAGVVAQSDDELESDAEADSCGGLSAGGGGPGGGGLEEGGGGEEPEEGAESGGQLPILTPKSRRMHGRLNFER